MRQLEELALLPHWCNSIDSSNNGSNNNRLA
jgi:hypothetical protein